MQDKKEFSEQQIADAWDKASVISNHDTDVFRTACDPSGATIRRDRFGQFGKKFAWRISSSGFPVYAGPRPLMAVLAQVDRQRREKEAALKKLRQHNLWEREIRENPMRPIPQDELELAVLDVLKSGQGHRTNLIGREFQRGGIECHLGTTLDNGGRFAAAKSIDRLLARQMIQPTFRDLADPENWYEITDIGRAASESGHLDDLDKLLSIVSPKLPELRKGCWHAINQAGPDWARHAAASFRQMVTNVLNLAAPDEKIRAQTWFEPDSTSRNGITRRQRIRFILQGRPVFQPNLDDEETLDLKCALLLKRIDKLSATVHGDNHQTQNDVSRILRECEELLSDLLKKN